MLDLAACRAVIADAFAAVGVNVYAYPPAQPEYPALGLGPFEAVEYHATVGEEGVRVQWRAELFVAYGESPAEALPELEQMTAGFSTVLDAIPKPWPWASCVARRAERVRERGTGDAGRALSVDVVIELTA